MCSSPPFLKWGKSFVVTSNLFSTNRMFSVRAAQRDADTLGVIFARCRVQNAQSWSATIRQRDGAPAGSCKLKPRQEQKPAPLSNAWRYQPAYGRAGAGTGKKPSAYEQLIQFDPMTGLPNRNNLHITSMTWSTKPSLRWCISSVLPYSGCD